MSEALTAFADQVRIDSRRVASLERSITWLKRALGQEIDPRITVDTEHFGHAASGYRDSMDLLIEHYEDRWNEAIKQTLDVALAELDVLRAKYASLVPQLAADAEEQAL